MALLLLAPLGVQGQETAADSSAGAGPALRLMHGDVGIGIGHVPRVTGLRINLSDRSLDRVTGANVTLWRPRDGGPVGGRVRGLAIGLAPQAGFVDGVGLGLAAVGEEGMAGIQLGGLAAVAGESLRGIQAGGLAAVSGSEVHGIQLGGLAVVAAETLKGIQMAGLGVVAGCRMQGVQIAGIGAEVGRECEDAAIRGLTAAGYRVRAPEIHGVTAALLRIEAETVRGLSVGGLQRSQEHVGLAVGVVNWTDRLRGVQLGVLNRAGNNPHPFRVLPLVNLNLG